MKELDPYALAFVDACLSESRRQSSSRADSRLVAAVFPALRSGAASARDVFRSLEFDCEIVEISEPCDDDEHLDSVEIVARVYLPEPYPLISYEFFYNFYVSPSPGAAFIAGKIGFSRAVADGLSVEDATTLSERLMTAGHPDMAAAIRRRIVCRDLSRKTEAFFESVFSFCVEEGLLDASWDSASPSIWIGDGPGGFETAWIGAIGSPRAGTLRSGSSVPLDTGGDIEPLTVWRELCFEVFRDDSFVRSRALAFRERRAFDFCASEGRSEKRASL